jgi:hypothetical protein
MTTTQIENTQQDWQQGGTHDNNTNRKYTTKPAAGRYTDINTNRKYTTRPAAGKYT